MGAKFIVTNLIYIRCKFSFWLKKTIFSIKGHTNFSIQFNSIKSKVFCFKVSRSFHWLTQMILSSLTTGAPSAVTDLSAPIFGILGIIGFAIFAIGGKKDSDGQGTNSSPYLANSIKEISPESSSNTSKA